VEAAALEEASRNEARALEQKREKDRAANKAWTANMLAQAESKRAAAAAQRAAELEFSKAYTKV
jgi:hypothetical protein